MIRHSSNKRTLEDPLLPQSTKRKVSSLDGKERDTRHEEDNKNLIIADHYSARPNLTVEEREASPIIHLKKLNNWVKSVLIQLYAKEGDSILDLACGKGGDLNKWEKAKISYYVGVDIAKGSIEDARNRYNGETDHVRRQRIPSFPARLICADCYGVSLAEPLKYDSPFDICSCQFALHYSWSSEERARQALANVAALLKPGGYFIGTIPDANVIVRKLREADSLFFGNKVYSINFDELYHEKRFPASQLFGIQYEFHLEDAVDCPEWLVPFSQFRLLAEEYDLELVSKMNFHEFVHEHVQQKRFEKLMRNMGALGGISNDEWDAAYIYMTFIFRKTGKSQSKSQHVQRKVPGPISQEEIVYLQIPEPEYSNG
eukprot:c24259_g1_i1 orf=3-1121(+)